MTRRDFLHLAAANAAAGIAALAGPEGLLAAAREKAKPLNLKITDLKTFVVYAEGKNYVFVKIYTNQGITGLGEGSVTSKAATMNEAIQEHKRYLVGRDPTEIERSTLQNVRLGPPGRASVETPQEVIDRFGELSDAGAQHVIFELKDVHEPEYLDIVGRDILPALHALP